MRLEAEKKEGRGGLGWCEGAERSRAAPDEVVVFRRGFVEFLCLCELKLEALVSEVC